MCVLKHLVERVFLSPLYSKNDLKHLVKRVYPRILSSVCVEAFDRAYGFKLLLSDHLVGHMF